MQFNFPKNDSKYFWTQHSIYKMKQYGLSPQRVKRVIRNPLRTETGIVKNTIAVMQPPSMSTKDGKRVWNQEIWVMYQLCETRNAKRETKSDMGKVKKTHLVKSSLWRGVLGAQFNRVKIISAWRYPGVSPKNNPIPEEILREISETI